MLVIIMWLYNHNVGLHSTSFCLLHHRCTSSTLYQLGCYIMYCVLLLSTGYHYMREVPECCSPYQIPSMVHTTHTMGNNNIQMSTQSLQLVANHSAPFQGVYYPSLLSHTHPYRRLYIYSMRMLS